MLLEQVATLVNRNIDASPRARDLAARLEGRSMSVRVQGPVELTLRARVHQQRILLSMNEDREADVAVSGTPLALLALLGGDARGRLQAAGQGGALALTGDAAVAQEFHELFDAARPELEEELARVLGDVAARQLGNTVRSLAGWGRRTAAVFAENVSEFLQEESRDLVSRTEAEEYNAAVDSLREAVDRLGARIELLSRAASSERLP